MIPVPTKNPLWPLVLFLAATTACAASGTNPEGPNATAPIDPIDGAWLVTSFEGPLGPLDAGATSPIVIDLNTETMTLEGTAGCGTFFGSFSFGKPGSAEYAGLTIPGRSDSDCDRSVREAQDAAIAALEGISSFVLGENRLDLSGPGSSAVLEPAN